MGIESYRQLRKFQDEVLSTFPGAVPRDALEFARLHCFVSDHAEADRAAKAWSADVVLWGKAYFDDVTA